MGLMGKGKAIILVVGAINEDGRPVGWSFDFRGNNPDGITQEMAVGLQPYPDGITRWGGYTLQELSVLARVVMTAQLRSDHNQHQSQPREGI